MLQAGACGQTPSSNYECQHMSVTECDPFGLLLLMLCR